MLDVGRYRLAAVLDGTFAVDGGEVFGVVPRPEWEKELIPDPRNRVRLAARCLLAVDADAGRRVLVDCGIGGRCDAVRVASHAVDRPAGGLEAALAALGVPREDVTDVVITHLHFDHAGGLARRGERGSLELTFPNATHHVQRRNWLWAHGPSDKDAGSFLPESIALLEHSARLHLLDGERELFPDLEIIVSEGHTVAQQLARFHGEGTHVTYCGDVIPTRAHVRVPWVMASDLFPLTTIDEKKVLLAQALEDGGVLVFEHDPLVAGCRIEERDGQPAFREAVTL